MNSCKTPKIYYKFEAKDRDSDELINYRIQDLPEELYEMALELYVKEFIPDEILSSSRDVHKNPLAVEDLVNIWREVMKQRLILACFRDIDTENDEIVAVNILYISSKHTRDESKYEVSLRNLSLKLLLKLIFSVQKSGHKRYNGCYKLHV